MLTNDERWEQYQSENLSYFENKQWGLFRNNYWRMTDLLLQEKNYHQAAYFALCVLYLDINWQNNNLVDLSRQTGYFEGFTMPVIAPAVAGAVQSTKEYLSRELISHVYETFDTSYAPISEDSFFRLAQNIATGRTSLRSFKEEICETFINNCTGVKNGNKYAGRRP